VILGLWDTAGQEEYDRLRPLSYPGADVILLCFSTISRASYESITDKWAVEVNHFVPDVPLVVVGTKIDLREAQTADPNTGKYDPLNSQKGEELARQIRAKKYMEVSAKTRDGLEDVFNFAMDLVLEREAHSGSGPNPNPNPKVDNKPKKKCALI